MSLDVTLYANQRTVSCTCDCGHIHTRDAVDDVFSANITHNLNSMAEEAGIYKQVWRPEECGITKAEQLLRPLRAGIALMKAEPERFKKLSASNSWGTYEQFVPWLERYLAACEEYPEATVHASR